MPPHEPIMGSFAGIAGSRSVRLPWPAAEARGGPSARQARLLQRYAVGYFDFVAWEWQVARSEDDVDLADRLVDLPGPGPAQREHGRVAGADLERLAALGRDGHPSGHDVHELVGLELPVRRAGCALPHPDLLVAVLPERQPGSLHRLPGRLFQRTPVLKLGGRGGSQVRRYVGH